MENNNTNLSTEVATAGTTGIAALDKLTGARVSYCSMSANTDAEKLKLFKAINDTDMRLSDVVNTTIMLKDIYAEQVDFADEETGEITPGVRIVLVDENGTSYGCASQGVFNAINKLISIFGEPTWETPIPVKVKEIKKGKKSLYTLTA